jgi:radical SAM protein with 4Fe4S-binding SPASM domain
MKLEYFLFATNDCNLHCDYCSVLEESIKCALPRTPQYKITDLIKFILTTQSKFNSAALDIIFFGGEPTLNYDFIKEVIIEFENAKTNLTVNYILHTNGLFLTKLPKEIANKLKLIIVSINYEKISKSNLLDGYFGSIVNNVNSIRQSYSIPLLARLTITENVSLFFNVLQISNFFDYVYWQLQNCFSFKDFNLFYSNYSFELELLWDYWIRFYSQGVQLNFLPFASITHLLLKKRNNISQYLCGYNEFMLYIQTNGDCYSCSEEIIIGKHFLIGNITDGIKFKEQNLTQNSNCLNCNYISLCSGRCGRMQERFSKDHIKEYCKLNQILFNKIISNRTYLEEIIKKYPYLDKRVDDPFFRITEYVP